MEQPRRFNFESDPCYGAAMEEVEDGDYMSFKDHERIVKEMMQEIHRLQQVAMEYENDLQFYKEFDE